MRIAFTATTVLCRAQRFLQPPYYSFTQSPLPNLHYYRAQSNSYIRRHSSYKPSYEEENEEREEEVATAMDQLKNVDEERLLLL
ncbi:hypothetical protein M0R45_015347 [Rubus argutus]|uniref:Uncharacterized protein n=1 Tax=Rubus argutus TaxID=59490 RepID=A0AAW1XQJ9_RUBAR